ncbi:MAG: 3-methyl-2-oxobutanoate dehydrogenase subunit beta [Deltaproteobacteria bacterium]
MAEKVLMRGSHVIGEAAVRAGCRFYAGYPITPQNELTEYMSQEGMSYLAAQELPAVIVNTMRGGPGLGNIAPSQGDYFQATRGGGHGDYRHIVLAPASGQELADLTRRSFDYADKYRTPVMILGDGMMGQMMEPVEFPEALDLKEIPSKPWKLDGAKDRPSRVILSLLLDPAKEEELNWKLVRKYEAIEREITSADTYLTKDAHMVIIAYGTAARIAKGAVRRVRELGLKVGLMRPITLWPYPKKFLIEMSRSVKDFLVFEMSTGQMLEDVKLSLEGRGRVHFYGRPGGIIPTPDEIAKVINSLYHRQHLEGS